MIRKQRSGFTLIEILIVIGIIGVLVAVLVTVLISARSKGDEYTAQHFVNNVIPSAIERWQDATSRGRNDFPRSPNMREGGDYIDGNAELFHELVTLPQSRDMMPFVPADVTIAGEVNGKRVFLDPWGNPYIYRNYMQRRSLTGAERTYRGTRHNDTYDLISPGPDGEYGTHDDVFRSAR
jgi:prepilin-type N-terminal cleavage/methylation domain-containing protein